MQIDETHSDADLFNTEDGTEGTDGSMSDQNTEGESSESGGDWLDDGAKAEEATETSPADEARQKQVAAWAAKGEKGLEELSKIKDKQWLIPLVKEQLKTSNPEDIIAKAAEAGRLAALKTFEEKQQEAEAARAKAEFDSLFQELNRVATPEQKKQMNIENKRYLSMGLSPTDALSEAAARAGVDRTGTVKNRESYATVRSGGAPVGEGEVNWEDPNLDITKQSPAKLAKMAKMKR